ncbi:MAG TPA: MFS transporter [Candidatus Angelobacter sp.]|nr:MFS transporter [Candidatus Angelobacter sp.]
MAREPEVLPPAKIWFVLMASAVGTMIEWYDFYIFASLATVLSGKFYPKGNDLFTLIAYYSTLAAGFVVRPFGALFFGRIGDKVGRKYAFLVTLVIMGGATFVIGLLPTFAQAGWIVPISLIAIRILQGLALGGEYGGAAIYVAEHVPDNKRGFYTSFIQITATLGLLVSLLVTLVTQNRMSAADFDRYGWRIPFLISFFLVAVSLYIRLKMRESPIFEQIKSSGMTSTKPLTEAFAKWDNLKLVLISLFGATAGQGVVWYTGQFYANFYLETILKLSGPTAKVVMAVALLAGMPFFVVFGALSDKIGRKKIMMAGCLLAVLAYYPIYGAMQKAAGNNIETFTSTKNKVTGAITLISQTRANPNAENPADRGPLVPAKEATNANLPLLTLLIFIQVIFVCMVYAPIAAYLVEAFPAKIRYTSLSLPYHIGNGIFGGLLPLIGLYSCAVTGNLYAGLWYPMTVAGITFIIGSLFLPETHHRKIWQEVSSASK